MYQEETTLHEPETCHKKLHTSSEIEENEVCADTCKVLETNFRATNSQHACWKFFTLYNVSGWRGHSYNDANTF